MSVTSKQTGNIPTRWKVSNACAKKQCAGSRPAKLEKVLTFPNTLEPCLET